MADGKHWWKMHTSLLSDDKILSLPPADRWAWVALAAHTREHGEAGRLTIDRKNPFLALIFGCSPDEVLPTIKRLPNVTLEESENCNSKITLHYKNWRKYAEDNSLERVKKHREKQKRNATEERRREESREEEKTTSPISPPGRKKRQKQEPSEAETYQESWITEPWPSVRRFVAMYNTQIPPDWAMVKTVSSTQAEKIRSYLRQFRPIEFWQTTFTNCGKGRFCTRTLEQHNRKLSWLLQMDQHRKGENCVKVHDGEFLGD